MKTEEGLVAHGNLVDHLEGRRSEMVDLLHRLAELESPTTEPESQWPVMDLLARSLGDVGYRPRRFNGRKTGGQLLLRPPRGRRPGPYQVIVGHTDTVWPRGTLDTMPVELDEHVLRGPGVFDMKGGLVQMVFALRALAELGLEPSVTPVVFLNSDEELGSFESENRIHLLASRADRAYVLEPALGLEGRLKTTRRGTGQFELRVVGKSSHTGLAPGEGVSAIQEMGHIIHALHRLSDPERGIGVNVGQVQGGTRPNVVAAECSAVVDVRVRTIADGRWVEEQILSLEPVTPGTEVHIEGSVDRPPMEGTPRNRLLWGAARSAAALMGVEVEEGMSGGASDGNFTSLHTATLDGLGSVGDGAHAVHEFVDVRRMPERAALLALLLLVPPLPDPREVDGEPEAWDPFQVGGTL